MHLTNYSINKNSENFVHDEDTGSKRCAGAACPVWKPLETPVTSVVCFGPQKAVHPKQAAGVTGLQHGEDVDRHWGRDRKDADLGSSHPQAQLPHLLPQPHHLQRLLRDSGLWRPAGSPTQTLGAGGGGTPHIHLTWGWTGSESQTCSGFLRSLIETVILEVL